MLYMSESRRGGENRERGRNLKTQDGNVSPVASNPDQGQRVLSS